MEQIKILAIDQASKCGWAISKDLHGCWDMSTRKDEDSGMKLLRFKAKLKEICKAEDVQMIVYERVAGQHSAAIIHAAKMVAIIETFCIEHGLNYTAVSASEVKKFATGKGNAKKDSMIEAARLKYGYTGQDDNVADALHILHLAQRNLAA